MRTAPDDHGSSTWASKVDGYERQVGPEAEVGLENEEPTARLYARRLDVREPLEMRVARRPRVPVGRGRPRSCASCPRTSASTSRSRSWVCTRRACGTAWSSGQKRSRRTFTLRSRGRPARSRQQPGCVDLRTVANVGGTDIHVYHIPTIVNSARCFSSAPANGGEAFVVPRVMPGSRKRTPSLPARSSRTGTRGDAFPALVPGHEHLALAREYGRLRGAAKRADSAVDACAAKLCAVIMIRWGCASDDERIRDVEGNGEGESNLRVDIKED